jgi:Co/Zn/Cd efflux system component
MKKNLWNCAYIIMVCGVVMAVADTIRRHTTSVELQAICGTCITIAFFGFFVTGFGMAYINACEKEE